VAISPRCAASTDNRSDSDSDGQRDEIRELRDRISEAAYDVFVEYGYDHASMSEIARRANVSVDTLRRLHPDRAQFLNEVLRLRFESVQSEFLQVNDDEPIEKILFELAEFGTDVIFNERAASAVRLMISVRERIPQIGSTADRLVAGYGDLVISVFDQLVAAQRIPEQDTALTARMFIDLTQGVAALHWMLSWRDAPPTEDELRRKVALFMRGRFGLAL